MPYTLTLTGELTGPIFLQIDSLLPQLGTVAPNGVNAAAHIGARYIDTVTKTEYKASTADGTIGGTTWDVVVNTIVDATETVKGVVEFATSLELAAGVDNTKAVTPFSMAGTFALVTDFQDEINDRISGDNALDARLDAAEATLTDAVSAATPSVLMKRDAAGRSKVADGAASTDIATKGQMDTADAAIQSQVTSLSTDVTTNATSAATANRLVRRDSNARFQAAAASAAADVVIKSQLDTTDGNVTALTAVVGTPTDAATVSTLVKRDAAGRFKAVAGSASTDVIVKSQLDTTDGNVTSLTSVVGTPTDAATVSQIIKRDAAGRAKVVDGAVASDIATKGQVDTVATALGTPTASPTVSTIVKRDAAGRFQAVAGSAADDVVIKSQLDAVGSQRINNYRLSVSSSDPNPVDTTGVSTIYLKEYNGDALDIYNGSSWSAFSALSLSIAVPSTQYFRIYDVFADYNSGTPQLAVTAWDSGGQSTKAITLLTIANPCVITCTSHGWNVGDKIGIRKGTAAGTAWSDTGMGLDQKEFYISAKTTHTLTLEGCDTSVLAVTNYTGATAYKIPSSRTTAIVRQNGTWCQSGTLTKRFLGTFKTNGAGTVDDSSVLARNLSNVDNQIDCHVRAIEPASSWTSPNLSKMTARSGSFARGVTRFEFVLALPQTIDFSDTDTSAGIPISTGLSLNRVEEAVSGALQNLVAFTSVGYASGYTSQATGLESKRLAEGSYFTQKMAYAENAAYFGDLNATYAGSKAYCQARLSR